MEQIEIPGSARSTTQLGFGCSSLMGATGKKHSLELLNIAYEAGIRHFDVAPMYGFGEAEGCLGEFLSQGHRDVTVTTKFGIAPARNRALLNFARHAVRPILNALPSAKRRLTKAANTVANTGARLPFSVEQASLSLENSLRSLRSERIDIFLLHEASAGDLNDPSLLRFLESAVAAGKIGTFGIGSEAKQIPAILTASPDYCRVLQHEWSALDGVLAASNAFTIYHRVLTERFRTLHTSLIDTPDLISQWSSELGVDLRDPHVFASLILRSALDDCPESIILFSSKHPEHIRLNTITAEQASLAKPARMLRQKLQASAWA